jgi:ATP-dependent Clp protease ATP-binding subunit ClpB
LKRAIQRYLQDPLADMLLRGGIPDGATVMVNEGDGGLVLNINK